MPRRLVLPYSLFTLVLHIALAPHDCLAAEPAADHAESEGGWVSLFNGEDLAGWRASENEGTFRVEDGVIVVHGPRSHLFYEGPVGGADFKDFEWKCDVKTTPGSNSGMYFHTEYQEEGWPVKGYEVQVNATHGDARKTGGLYAIEDVMDDAPHEDGEWFTQHVVVRGKRIVVRVNGEVTTDFTEPEDHTPPEGKPGRLISHGTFALQGHDPASKVYFKNLLVRPLD
ncbi:hypothetical protein Mal64_21300 [Pseudobythopirellula maris]|uniref:3-keto-alpha-glucoside-1,2-lyase/3-keto-2-hydroxy-glucal hydratase domain-containing protein n=1 Tax=Pseudobythopirellula maris TaxID=2527991 RepID=A0A5C5ZQS1_9BACT|nr:DUF1080 domain-containing protein [Pseudobythopirellula maris]TWT88643.1 hypothetical protein Mal64_21300 [Pseudobythopirellula maris]